MTSHIQNADSTAPSPMSADTEQLGLSSHLKAASDFLSTFDPEAKAFTFQAFDDDKRRKDPSLARILHGPFDQVKDQLADLNARGAGIFFTVNETDLRGRKTENILRVRAFWQEDDNNFDGELPLEPTLVVQSSPSKFHRYWCTTGVSLDHFGNVMANMVANYGSDPNAKDLARVLRVPGFLHRKGEPFCTRIMGGNGKIYRPEDILPVFLSPSQELSAQAQRLEKSPSVKCNELTFADSSRLCEALSHIPASDREVWLKVGMGLHEHWGGGEQGFKIWDEWSRTSADKYDEADQRMTWNSFRPGGGRTIASTFALAKDNGWLPTQSPPEFPVTNSASKRSREGGATEAGQSAAARLTQIARQRCTLVRDADKRAFALFENHGHRECWLIESSGFTEWLNHQFYLTYGNIPSEVALKSALTTLKGQARFDGEMQAVYFRVAYCDLAYWIDLCDDDWRAVRITESGWSIVERPPVLFARSSSMRSLPNPEEGGDVFLLMNFVNIEEEDSLIVITWLLECLRPETPFPLLEINGEQGSAKSTTQNTLRELIDPNKSNLRSPPKKSEDLVAMAAHSHLVSFENVSRLSDERQDELCRLATGSGFSRRALYTDFDETVVNLKRPVALNGIGTSVTRQDLLDRTVNISLPVIEDRRTATEMIGKFEATKGRIFSGLLDMMVKVMRVLPRVKIDSAELPRMADFAILGEAVGIAMGRHPGTFIREYAERRRTNIYRILQGSPVAVACLVLLEDSPTGYSGTVKTLYDRLSSKCRSDGNEAWPKSPRGLADALRRVAPAFRQLGFKFTIGEKRTAEGYWCEIRRLPQNSTITSVRDERCEHSWEEGSMRPGEAEPAKQLYEEADQNSFSDNVHDVHNVHDTTPSNRANGDRVRFKL